MYRCSYSWTKLADVHLHYMNHGTDKIQKRNKIFVMLPGNPGSMYFYDKFAHVLHEKTGIPVWGISHTGHVSINGRMNDEFEDINHPETHQCGLTEQIKHKCEFLKQNILPHYEEVYLIGHSIGCYIALHVLKELNDAKLKKAILLFPTIEHMGKTENGKRAVAVSPLQWSVWYLGTLIKYLPSFIRKWISQLVVKTNDNSIHETVLQDVVSDPNVLHSSTYMGKQEMEMVTSRNDKIIEEFSDRLLMYYGYTDLWCPREYFYEIKKRHSNVQMKLCDQGYKHAFVLEDSEDVANMVSDWYHNDFTIS